MKLALALFLTLLLSFNFHFGQGKKSIIYQNVLDSVLTANNTFEF